MKRQLLLATAGLAVSAPAFAALLDMTTVPEPAMWLTMIIAFGIAGVALRIRRRLSADGKGEPFRRR